MRKKHDVRRRRILEPFHWALWATEAREGVALGYPTHSVGYTPPRRGDIDTVLPPAATFVSDTDRAIVELLSKTVNEVKRENALFGWVLEAYHGAYPGAIRHRGDRLATRFGKLSRATFYRQLNRATRLVESRVERAVDNGPNRIAA